MKTSALASWDVGWVESPPQVIRLTQQSSHGHRRPPRTASTHRKGSSECERRRGRGECGERIRQVRHAQVPAWIRVGHHRFSTGRRGMVQSQRTLIAKVAIRLMKSKCSERVRRAMRCNPLQGVLGRERLLAHLHRLPHGIQPEQIERVGLAGRECRRRRWRERIALFQ